MSPDELISWRQRMKYSPKAAAEQLGLSQNGYAAYERGWVEVIVLKRMRIPRPIPKHVELACAYLEHSRSLTD